jgi:hypothetical protein
VSEAFNDHFIFSSFAELLVGYQLPMALQSALLIVITRVTFNLFWMEAQSWRISLKLADLIYGGHDDLFALRPSESQ